MPQVWTRSWESLYDPCRLLHRSAQLFETEANGETLKRPLILLTFVVVLITPGLSAFAEDGSPRRLQKVPEPSKTISTQPPTEGPQGQNAPPEKKDAKVKQPSHKEPKRDGVRSGIRVGYGGQSSVQTNEGTARRLERDVRGSMREVDNAIRRMNIDINRIRNLERRF